MILRSSVRYPCKSADVSPSSGLLSISVSGFPVDAASYGIVVAEGTFEKKVNRCITFSSILIEVILMMRTWAVWHRERAIAVIFVILLVVISDSGLPGHPMGLKLCPGRCIGASICG